MNWISVSLLKIYLLKSLDKKYSVDNYFVMKNCCFIVPYFGKLPNYFQLFLNSCAWNEDYNWLIFADDLTSYEYPKNVMKINTTFDELKKLIIPKFDFNISLLTPYKLCDYKPAYGYIFEKYICDYKFWGHCDIDIIMGKISNFITDDMLDIYDKLFCLGHFTLYRNTIDNNRLFMSEYKGELLYKQVFSSPNIWIFDEEFRNDKNVNQIFLSKGKSVYQEDLSLNVFIFTTSFRRIQFIGVNNGYENAYILEKNKEAIYLWNRGKIERYLMDKGRLVREEFLYIHLQKRQMGYCKKKGLGNVVKILPNKFVKLEFDTVTEKNFRKITKVVICFHKLRLRYTSYYKRIVSKCNDQFSKK